MTGRARLARTGELMPKTLLLADDSIVIQKLVGLSFANEDVQIVATDNGDDAIARAREVVPDVVLADVVMPGKNGYEVCEAIKQDAGLAHVPVLLLTGTFEVFDEARATRARADGQITKPFEARALVERVNEYMNRPAAAPPTDGTNVEAATVAVEDDLFDPNVTTLSPLEAASVPDGHPGPGQGHRATGNDDRASEGRARESGDSSSSLLFGAPGEGASEDDLEPEIGGLALGQTVSKVERSPSPGERTLDETPARETASTPSAATSATSEPAASQTDDFRAFEDDLGLDEPLEFSESLSVSADDLEEALGAPDDDGGWLGGLEQPRDADPFSISGDISGDISGNTESRQTALDGASSSEGAAPRREEPTRPRPDPDAPGKAPSDLDLGPADLASDDLEFGFDVSEQVAVDRPEDSFEDVGASSIDAGEADSTGRPAPAAPPSDTVVAPQRSPASWETEDLLVGYDVLRSDLAPDPAEPGTASAEGRADPGVEVSEPIPASAAFAPTPDLSPQRIQSDEGPARSTPSSPSSVSPSVSPTPESAVAGGPVGRTSEAASLVGLETGRGDPQAQPESLDPEPDVRTGIAATEQADDTIVAEPDWLDPNGPPEPIDLAADPEPGPTRAGIDEEPIHSARGATAPEDRRIADLSPLMEQRIHETLEKVAWEAFADLSESIVKQVMGRVEQIAWEVIPQMAETLVREEIRRMKGEDD